MKKGQKRTRYYKFPKYRPIGGGPQEAGRSYRMLAKQHLTYARGYDKAADKRKREIGRSDSVVKAWRAEARRERNIARRALEKARRYRGVYSRDTRRRGHACRDCIGIHTHENMGRAALRDRRRKRRRGRRR